MKTLFLKLFPGVAVTAAALLGIAWMRAQAETHPAAPAAAVDACPPAAAHAAPESAPPLLMCGACGAQLETPRAVFVAMPVRGGAGEDAKDLGDSEKRGRRSALSPASYYLPPPPATYNALEMTADDYRLLAAMQRLYRAAY